MDYKKLDVERAKMAVSVAGAKSLVSEWMGSDVFDDDAEDEIVQRLLGSAAKATPVQTEKNLALERLRARGAKPNQNTRHLPPPTQQESSDEEESKTSSVGKRKPTKSVLDSYKKKKRKN